MVFALVASALATEDTCKPFELKHSTNVRRWAHALTHFCARSLEP